MTLPTSSLFPLSTPLPLLMASPQGLAAAILMQNLSRISMLREMNITNLERVPKNIGIPGDLIFRRLLLHIQRESWSTRLIFLIRERYKLNWHGKQMKGQARIYLKLGRWKLLEDEASMLLYVEFSKIMYLTQLLVTYLFDKMEEWLGIVLLEALQNGAAVLDLKKLENLFNYIFNT
ncbi:uncharacterized protein [Gossypium hirsutum]|uniref:Uncharacterized protein isoform X2 n=2 Tax=Gossypium hirsutum TaxID=3635 RepID=A0ABM3AW73_GOSHI|nr:uncharacterized protein LOC107914361 isoform X2 [Gossypium hirsutum]